MKKRFTKRNQIYTSGLLLSVLLLLAPSAQLASQTLSGTITDAGRGNVISGASVQIQSSQGPSFSLVTPSDEQGRYLLENIPPNFYTVTVEAPGYTTQKINQVLVSAGKDQMLDFQLFDANTLLPDVLICSSQPGDRMLQPLGEIPLTREQTLRFPAAFFDPARLVRSYPGVANADDQANGLVVRGNSPAALKWRLEGVDVVNPNHLNNAGTFGDLPTAASGGVLLFSAQLIDNSSLLTGSLPTGYGDALGGIMDIQLRNGNNRQHEFTAQAGLIGLDLAAEGPLSSKKSSSYLANYRYSTVGLLGKMGISFGGESIDFQDLSATFFFPGKKGSQWSVFAMAGQSANRFSPPSDSTDIQSYKDLFTIDYESKTGIAGLNFYTPLSKNSWIQWSLVGSAQENTRDAQSAQVLSNFSNTEQRLGTNVRVSNYLSPSWRLVWGANIQTIGYTLQFDDPQYENQDLDQQALLAQPWLSFEWKNKAGDWSARAGLHSLFTDKPFSEYTLEPRLLVSKRLAARHLLSLAYTQQSQVAPFWIMASQLQDNSGLTQSQQVALRHNWTLSDQWVLRSELFYQNLYNVPVAADPALPFSLLNSSEYFSTSALKNEGKGRNQGIELGLERYMHQGWFMVASLSISDAQYQAADGQWRASRWDLGHIANLTAGKEWVRSQKGEKSRAFGVNARAVWRGSYRELPIDLEQSITQQRTVFNQEAGYTETRPDFFRIDARVYWRKNIGQRRNSTFAMEFQNLSMQENIAYLYFDPYTNQIETKYQLSLIPNISWRLEF